MGLYKKLPEDLGEVDVIIAGGAYNSHGLEYLKSLTMDNPAQVGPLGVSWLPDSQMQIPSCRSS